MASAAVAIGVGEIVAGLLNGTSAIAAVGALVIALQPPWGKDLMTTLFGTGDKLALEVMVFVGGILLGALVGLLGRRDVRIAYGAFLLLGLAILALIIGDPLEDPFSAVVTAGAGAGSGLAMFMWLSAALAPVSALRSATPAAAPAGGMSLPRRGFLVIGATFVAVGAVLSVIGRYLGGAEPAAPANPVAVPPPSQTAPPLAPGTDFGIEGVTPIVVPNADFYQIDTRLGAPHIDPATWTLRIFGMVDREVTLTYEQLLAMPLVEQYVTIACVSNEVGGRLVGNAKWTGVNLNSILAMAGVQPGATQLVGHSFDWTCGFPTAHLSGAGKDALVAVLMNDEPLPPRHGYPARVIVPGLYGYVSATKWVTQIELTTLEAYDAYWVRLGWAKEGPILTQSRIDTPRPGQSLASGQVQIGGVAWAPTRGISRVEIDLDEDENWRPVQLSVPISNYTWVQWQTKLDMPIGRHTIRVRATDGSGAVQESRVTPPAPDGARGYHTVTFTAT
jgi:DMSO/TMAO reductase YedYZ molybdopterin-dependent catalytic subunit